MYSLEGSSLRRAAWVAALLAIPFGSNAFTTAPHPCTTTHHPHLQNRIPTQSPLVPHPRQHHTPRARNTALTGIPIPIDVVTDAVASFVASAASSVTELLPSSKPPTSSLVPSPSFGLIPVALLFFLREHPMHLVRCAVAASTMALAAASARRICHVRERQAMDLTSEWDRYAAKPGAKARAIVAGLARFLPLAVKALMRPKGSEARSDAHRKAGENLAEELIKLGPTYVKLGQILSCRDEVPREYVRALERLQDRVPAMEGERAAALIGDALSKPWQTVFERIDFEPLAAASLGQVHRAKLKDEFGGQEVAVKIQRPYLRQIYDRDLNLLRKVAKVLDRFKVGVGGAEQSWMGIYNQTIEVLYREIDYNIEAQNARRFKLTMNGNATDSSTEAQNPWVTTPEVYEDLCNEKVLVMEYLPGVKINQIEELDKLEGVDRQQIATNLARAYLLQFCKYGFFNTDPHPGNLAVDTGYPGGRLIFYDFGQACELSPQQREGILAVIESVIDLNAQACVSAFQKMGVLKSDADIAALEYMAQTNFKSGRVKSRASKSPNNYRARPSYEPFVSEEEAADEAAKTMRYFQLPVQYAFAARAFTQMNGVGKTLTDDFEFIASSAPYMYEIKGGEVFMWDLVKKEIRKFVGDDLPWLWDTNDPRRREQELARS